MDGRVEPMRWQELSGEERYQVVELARKGEISIRELCRTFGVSRQTLYRAMEAVDRASIEALEPKKRGRKRRPEAQVKAEELQQKTTRLEKEMDRWRQKYEVAKTILDLQRRMDRGEPLPGEEGEKNQESPKRQQT
jgi:transposase-like protein